MDNIAYVGEALSLLCAVTWAFAVILFRKSGRVVHPIGLNLYKNVLATVLFLPTIWILGRTLARPAPVEEYLLIFASGALGIGIADTLFLKSLNTLGAGLLAIVDCLYSPFIIALSIPWLGEVLDIWQIVGVVMIVLAVLTATRDRSANLTDRRVVFKGVIWGVLSLVAMALGIVMIKPVLDRSPLLWVTEIRLFGGVAVLLVVLLFHSSRRAIIRSVFSRQRWVYTLSGSFIGAYLSMVLWLGGMKFTQASVASALNQTTSIFIFILSAWLLREKITGPRLVGIGMGVGGALLVTFG